MWIPREISTLLSKIAKKRPSLIVTGCRQTGKTTLLKRVFPQANYVTLDLPLEAEQAEEAGEAFLQNYPSPCIIDEVQYAPQLFRYIKQHIDRHRNQNGQYLLTGSQKFQLMEKVSESLAGRCAVLECHSLSAREYEKWKKKKLNESALWEWIWKGGYPELHAKHLAPEPFYADYLATYLERDVRQIIQVRNLRDFNRFLRLSALRTGQLLSYHSMASDIGVSPNTIKSWLSVLESSNVIYLLEPYYQNFGKRIVKTPKLYFLDTGLASYLAGFRTLQDLKNSHLAGAFFETHSLGQIIRYYSNQGLRPNLYFYRDHYGHEVDFVIPVGEKLTLIECKLSPTALNKIKGFQEIEKLIGPDRILKKLLMTPQRELRQMSEKTWRVDSVEMGSLL